MDNPHSKKKRAIERIAMFSSCHHRIDDAVHEVMTELNAVDAVLFEKVAEYI